MASHYAFDKVLTAADTKHRLVQGLFVARQTCRGELTWNLNQQKYEGSSLLELEVPAAEPPQQQIASEEESIASTDSAPKSPDDPDSSTEASEAPVNAEDLTWFRQTNGRCFGLVQSVEHDRLTPWCRESPFAMVHMERGVGLEATMAICPRCVLRAPRAFASLIQQL